jgi:hypothetical protein
MAKKPVRRKKDMAKAKKGLRRGLLNSKSSRSKEARWKLWIWRHKKIATAMAAIIICVGVLSVFVPNNPEAMPMQEANVAAVPAYRLKVTITGIPKKIVLYHKYTYTISITNTGKKAFTKIIMEYWNARFVTGTSPKYNRAYKPDMTGGPSSIAWLNIANVKAGTTRTFKVYVTYNDPSQVVPYGGDQVRARVIGWNTPVIVDLQKGAHY